MFINQKAGAQHEVMLRANHNMAESFLPARQDITNNVTNNSYPTYNYTTNVTGMGAKKLTSAGSVSFTTATTAVMVLLIKDNTGSTVMGPVYTVVLRPGYYESYYIWGTVKLSSDGKTVTYTTGDETMSCVLVIPIYA